MYVHFPSYPLPIFKTDAKRSIFMTAFSVANLRCAYSVTTTLPSESMKWRCLKLSCSYHIVHCDYGKISSEEMKERIYKCNNVVEFEYDIEFVAKLS